MSSSPTASAASAAASTLTRRHSISTTTPVNEVKSLVTAAARARAAAHADGVDNNNISPLSELVKTELESRRKVDCVDAESNTVNSGKALIFASASYGFIMIGIYTAP